MMQKMMPVMMREMIPERKSYFQDSVHTHIHLEVMCAITIDTLH